MDNSLKEYMREEYYLMIGYTAEIKKILVQQFHPIIIHTLGFKLIKE